MNSKPTSKTTVVVLNWNSHEMNAECIRSLLGMDGSDCGILVVDNGSTDGSVQLLPKEFPQITVVPEEYRKNAGEHARIFTGSQNLLWLMHKHATRYQWLTFLPNFLVRYVLALVLYSIRHGDFRSAWAVFQGIAAFLRMRANADISTTLPPDLMARPKDAKLAGSLAAEKELADANRD